MVARVFRSLALQALALQALAPALAALGLLALRPAGGAHAAASPAGGEVVFRHYV